MQRRNCRVVNSTILILEGCEISHGILRPLCEINPVRNFSCEEFPVQPPPPLLYEVSGCCWWSCFGVLVLRCSARANGQVVGMLSLGTGQGSSVCPIGLGGDEMSASFWVSGRGGGCLENGVVDGGGGGAMARGRAHALGRVYLLLSGLGHLPSLPSVA